MVVAVVEAGQMYFVRTDHIGRPVFATDDLGAVVWEASYLPFGGVQTSTGANAELRFPGQWFQSETALHQNWMRDYDPTTGRYLQADPLGLVPGPSIYGYALQSPMMYVDPNGENPILIGMAIGFAAGALIDLLSQLYENDFDLNCVNLYQTAMSGGIGAVTGGAIGGAFRAFGVVSQGANSAIRPTYSIGRKNPILKRLGLRFESHPISRHWPNWGSYPHWHSNALGKKRHLPLVEPLATAAAAWLTPDLECECGNEL